MTTAARVWIGERRLLKERVGDFEWIVREARETESIVKNEGVGFFLLFLLFRQLFNE